MHTPCLIRVGPVEVLLRRLGEYEACMRGNRANAPQGKQIRADADTDHHVADASARAILQADCARVPSSICVVRSADESHIRRLAPWAWLWLQVMPVMRVVVADRDANKVPDSAPGSRFSRRRGRWNRGGEKYANAYQRRQSRLLAFHR